MEVLKKGKHYTKGEREIPREQFQKSACESSDGEYFFVTIQNDSKYQNELQYDGLVIGVKNDPVQYGSNNNTDNQGRHIMVRFNKNSKYEYIGDEDYRIRYDDKREKIILKKEQEMTPCTDIDDYSLPE
jgi:hypothetical protein